MEAGSEVRRSHNTNVLKAVLNALATSGIRDGSGGPRIAVEDIAEFPVGDGRTAVFVTHTARIGAETAALAMVPDDQTVSSEFVNRAAEQAATVMPGAATLVVVGFQFESDVRSGETQRRGKLAIVKVQAHRDLQVGNLDDRHADNAFVSIGEPDVEITENPENTDEIIVEVLGHDTYNPATGQIMASDADGIDCWMIDTNYDGKSFFAHRIHFPGKGKDRQIKAFKRDLGARVDPKLWTSMLSTQSAPFPKPKTGRIAVRIVTTTHVEMTTVREV